MKMNLQGHMNGFALLLTQRPKQGLKLRLAGCQCDQKLSVGEEILRPGCQWATHLFFRQP